MRGLDSLSRRLGLDPRALLGLTVLIGGLLLWVVSFTGGFASIFSSSTTTIKADFASVSDIVPNDPVRIHGVQVGSVGAVTPDPGGRGATLTLNLDGTAGSIYRNASAAVRWRTALGANDAVALDPGTPSAGPIGSATIPQSQDSNQVELDQITAAFHGGAQRGMQTLLQQLPVALSAHPALAQDLGVLARIAPQAAIGINALRGQVPDTDLRNLVRDAAQAAQALSVGTGASETRQFVQSAAQTLTAVSANDTALRQTMTGLAADLPLLTTTFSPIAGLDHNLTVLDGLLPKLTAVAPRVSPTLAALHPTLTDARTLLSDATPLLRKLRPAVDSLASTARVGLPVINNLNPGLTNLANKVLPGLAMKSSEEGGRPAYDAIGPTAVGIGTLADSFDQNGNFANLTAGLGQFSSQQFLPCTLDFSGTDLLVCESLSKSLADFLGGGSYLLSSLAKRPGAHATYGPLLSKSRSLEAGLAATEQTLSQQAPAAARALLRRIHVGSK